MTLARNAVSLTFWGAVVISSYFLLNAAWFAPQRDLDLYAAELQQELTAIVERGQRALEVLRSTPRPTESESRSIAKLGETVNLQEVVRDATVSNGGSLISSQSGDGGVSVLVRARFSEDALLQFVRAIETRPENFRFRAFEVHPVPTPQGFSVLELTAMLGSAAQDAN